MNLHSRIATALGWTEVETQSFSLPALRDLVRPVSEKLAGEISLVINGVSPILFEAGLVKVVDCLGRSRSPERVYPDGSWNCPFCSAAVQAGTPAHAALKCPNPGCFARGPEHPFPRETALKAIADIERCEREAKERAELDAWRRSEGERRRADQEKRDGEILSEAKRRGACVRCALQSASYGRAPRYIHHRSTHVHRASDV